MEILKVENLTKIYGKGSTKVIIEESNGRVMVETKKDCGTTFIIKYFKN